MKIAAMYLDFFRKVTGFSPYPWQIRFSTWAGESIAVISAPTGAGKEAGSVVPWLYSRYVGRSTTTRLIYALPTRSLVDQVYQNMQRVVDASGLSIPIYCLKGGLLEHGFEQNLAQPAILVGTQDQLLSRALNRGFGVSWEQRPLHFAALVNDCQWILDEVQLTGVAYRTLVQLYEHWQKMGTFGQTHLCLMSATFDDRPLQKLKVDRFNLTAEDLNHPFLSAKVTRPKPVSRIDVQSLPDLAAFVQSKYVPGSLSLVVLNTVHRARELGRLLAALDPLVIHSRFLGFDREKLQKRLYTHKGLVIATQVVEAGVDLDADLLITELCPWSSFVQRCGRCGRTRLDNAVEVIWVNYQQDWKALPYEEQECQETLDRLQTLRDASLHNLSQILAPNLKLPSYPLVDRDITTIFCTHYKSRDTRYTVSQYVRDPQAFTVSVVWSGELPERLPHQRFVCPVPTSELNKFCAAQGIIPQVWGEDAWEEKIKVDHGDVVWLPLSAGGYSHDRGWTGDSNDRPEPYSLKMEPQYNDPPFKHNLSLGIHLKDTEDCLREILSGLTHLDLPEALVDELCRCARWHDWGKAHEVWQAFANAGSELLAKSTHYGNPRAMNGFRHELASAIAAATQGAPFLAQYLIAAHHGKVRESLAPPHPNEPLNTQTLRGVELGSALPVVEIEGIETLPTTKLTFPPGFTYQHWKPQVMKLLRDKAYGPFRLSYLEALIRNADVKASEYRSTPYFDPPHLF